MSLRWWGVVSTLLFIVFLLLSEFIGAGTQCQGLPRNHEWVSDCDTALEKLEALQPREEEDDM